MTSQSNFTKSVAATALLGYMAKALSATNTDVSPSGWEFDETDDDFCRMNFNRVDQIYVDDKAQYESDAAELELLYNNIFNAMNEAAPRFIMVENYDFICWMANYIPVEANEDTFLYNPEDYQHLPAAILAIDLNKDGISDYIELMERDFKELIKQRKLNEFQKQRNENLECPNLRDDLSDALK